MSPASDLAMRRGGTLSMLDSMRTADGSIAMLAGSSAKHHIDAMKKLLELLRRESPNTPGEERPIDGDDLGHIRH